MRKIGPLMVVLLAGGLLLGACSGSHSPAATSKPYPLNIPPHKRNANQEHQARLMYLPYLSETRQVPPLPPDLAGKVHRPQDIAQVRLSYAAPSMAYSTGASWNTQLISVYSTDPKGTAYQVAIMVKPDCWYLKYTPGARLQYGMTTLSVKNKLTPTQVGNGCDAEYPPGSGWLNSWPTPNQNYPPVMPILIPKAPK